MHLRNPEGHASSTIFQLKSILLYRSVGFPQCGGDAADQRLNFSNSRLRLYIQGSSHGAYRSRAGEAADVCLCYFNGKATEEIPDRIFKQQGLIVSWSSLFLFPFAVDIGQTLSKESRKERGLASRILRRRFGNGSRHRLKKLPTSTVANYTNDVIAKK